MRLVSSYTLELICYGGRGETKATKWDYLYFGREDKGLGEQIINAHLEQCITIKMRGDVRSINLANSVAIVLYEALRQDDSKSTI